ncbi:MAG: FHA domain-containing protein [Gammaproteobacteria bacterium]|nr:FHA domain-containing protein [Gammaproteobacteria bacterium]
MSQLALLVDNVVVSLFPLDKPVITIGRDHENDIRIDDTAASTHHACLKIEPSKFLEGHEEIFIEDLGSTNGTMVNDEKVERCQLKPNDVITIAWNTFKLIDDSESGRQTTAFIGRT